MFNLQPITDISASSLPGRATIYKAVPGQSQGLIDVISDFTFTASPITPYLKNKIPYIVLFEHDVEYNSTLASLLYYTKLVPGASDVIGRGVGAVAGVAQTGANKIQTWVEELLNKVPLDATNKDLINKAANIGPQSISNMLADVAGSFNSPTEFTNPVLAPYNGLYLRRPTGFSYILPYYDNKKRNISSLYGDTQQGLVGKSGVTTLLGSVKEKVEQFLGTTLLASPGAFIETPKFYNMPDGESITVNFNLLNTINPYDYIMHYDFLFLLTFQNIHYRKDLARIIPPKMYRCIIPGEQEFPFCYVERMDVNFKGNRRILPIRSRIGGAQIDAIIPDAYEVSITIKSLTPSSGNFMVANNNIVVNTIAINPSVAPGAPVTTTNGVEVRRAEPVNPTNSSQNGLNLNDLGGIGSANDMNNLFNRVNNEPDLPQGSSAFEPGLFPQ